MAYAALLLVLLFIAQTMRIFDPPFGAALLLLVVVGGLAVVRPAFGLGLLITLAIVGDGVAMVWWPAVKNFSSTESVLYLSDQLTINPFEIILAMIAIIWLVDRHLTPNRPPIETGLFWRPLVLFTLMLFFGLCWGLGRGGDLRVVVFELRPLLYLPLVYLVMTNLFTSLVHYHRLLWGVLIALTIEAAHGLFFLGEIRQDLAEEASPVEHTAALHMNLLVILLIATIWFGSTRIGKRPLLFLMAIPTVVLYLDAERRAAVVGLIIGGMSLAVVLFTRNRQKFVRIIPVMLVIGGMYCAAFWNAENQAGFPAQAVKIIVQPDSSPESDASSDLYREIENYNLNATIRSAPITGIGFGQAFDQPIPLPDISFFEFWEFIPHNSILWMWTKVGLVGFLSFLYLLGHGVAVGIRAASRIEDPADAAMVATLASFVPMTFVVAFVDITFDAQTMVLLATSFALIGSAERLAGLPPAGDEESAAAEGPRSGDHAGHGGDLPEPTGRRR